MTYILLINTSEVSCATNQFVLTKDHAKHIEDLQDLIQETEQMRKIQQKYIEAEKEKGFKEGYEEGLRKSLEEIKIQFSVYLESMSQRLLEMNSQSQQSIIDLAINMTRKIASDLGSDKMIAGIVLRAIKNIKTDKPLEIKVNPEIAKFVENKLRNIKMTDSNGSDLLIDIVADQNIGVLDCIITTDRGVTDASFEEQLKLLKQQLGRVVYSSNLDS